MCGISGILDPRGDPAERSRRAAIMSAALAHRGPDDQGAYSDSDVDLGFRRLSVIDLETGHQPIRLEGDRAVIVLNGEIYNYRELRQELAGRATFKTQGDVEVVLHLYAREGIDCLKRLNGMFALAIWDRERRTLWLARDRFGIKPLFFCREGHWLAFASELTALLAAGFPSSPRIDPLELRHFLAQKYHSPTGTIVAGVESLPPGSVLEIGPHGERSRCFWQAPEAGAVPADDDAVERLAEELDAAVKRQLVADVPVGVFLSGGVDSGTVATLACRHSAGRLSTFSVGFEGEGVANELPAATALARTLGTDHHALTLAPREVARDLPAILAALDGPLGDATAVPTWYLSRLARERVTVALSGEGADEIFGGYDRQRFDAWLDRIGPWGRRLVPAALTLARRPLSPRLRRRLGMPTGLARQLDWSRVFTAEEIDALTTTPVADEERLHERHADLSARFAERVRIDPINARLSTDRELFLVGDLLPKVDRMSMAHGLEVRVPYLDNEIADFVLPLPGRLKVRRGHVKWLLRRAAATRLGLEAATRPKQGFDVPVSSWLRGPLREALHEYLSPAAVRARGLFRPEVVSRLIAEHEAGARDHGERLWLLLALEGWVSAVLDRQLVGERA